MNWDLKEEVLLTNLLREKLHCKELELEQLQAELATALRGNEILKCEVQSALDGFSCASHKVKELEVQVIAVYQMYSARMELMNCLFSINNSCVHPFNPYV